MIKITINLLKLTVPDGRYVAGIGEVSALKQTTEVVKNWSVDDSGSLRISSGR